MKLSEISHLNLFSGIATSAAEARKIAEDLNTKDLVIKAQVNSASENFMRSLVLWMFISQVLAGGRGKGRFAKYPKGGVQLLFSAEEIEEAAKGMIGKLQMILYWW